MIRRLAQSPNLLRSYGEIITEHEKRGFIEKVDHVTRHDKAHYLSHHAVEKDSTTTPIRIVFDCSFRASKNSPSLNDCLVTGPLLLSDMCSIFIRFRTFTYGISTDIEKAFLHVGLDEGDSGFTRFFWLSDPMNPESTFQVYRFKAVLFGSTSSPFILHATLHHHLESYTSPVATDMKDNMYVDNIISGRDQETEVIHYFQESRSIMKDANFNLPSWASSSRSPNEHADIDQTAETNSIVNVLGLRWDQFHDTLRLTPKETCVKSSQPISKRVVLQRSSKTYDPLGFLSPVTIKAKLLMQDLWQQKVEWDEPLPQELELKWNSIARDIEDATKLIIPRRFFLQEQITAHPTSLHVFADASPKAYGAVAYLSSGDQSSLLMAKSRVAPLKTLTLPQLELMAPSICVRLANFISQALKPRLPNLKFYLWSDSEIVLHWLQSTKPLKQFAANRAKEVKKLFLVSKWHHCPTRDNPADLLTRGINSTQLHDSSLWLDGPQWLPFADRWPVQDNTKLLHLTVSNDINTNDTDTSEVNTATTSNAVTMTDPREKELGIKNIIDVSIFNTLSKLLAVTAYVLRLAKNLCNTKSKTTGPQTVQELKEDQSQWIKTSQTLVYSDEIKNLQSNLNTRLPLVR